MKRLRLYRHSAAKSVGVGSAFFLANEWAARRGAGNLRSGRWRSKTVRSTSLEMGELALTHSFAKDANEWGTRPVRLRLRRAEPAHATDAAQWHQHQLQLRFPVAAVERV